jgi:hypothetical protein
MDTRPETEEIPEKEISNNTEKLQPKGIKSIQGQEIEEDNPVPTSAEGTESAEFKLDPQSQEMYEEWKRTHNPANWEYKFGSPHADHQAAKDLQKAQRQHEIGQQAMTAGSLGDAIDTTLKAHKETNQQDETPGDQYFREKFGTHPYTTDAYPKGEEEEEEE